MSAASSRDPWTLLPERGLVLGTAVIVAIAFASTLGFGLVYDDHWFLIANGFLRCPGDLAALFGPEAVERSIPDAFRPTSVLFDMATYHALGLHAWLHHACNVLLHVGVGLAGYAWLRRLEAPLPLRIAATALYGVMAIHAEAIAVVTFREDLLAAGLGLGALASAEYALTATGRRRIAWVLLAGAAMASAAGAKMSAAPLPAVWVLAWWLAPWKPRAPARNLLAPAIGLAAGLGLVIAHHLALFEGLSPYASDARIAEQSFGRAAVLARSTWIHVGYLQQMIIPLGFRPEYVDAGASWSDATTIVCSSALLGLLGLGSYAAVTRRRPVLAFAILGAALLAIPTSNLVGMPNMRADRFMYLPSWPVCVGLGAWSIAVGRRWAGSRGNPVRLLGPLLALVMIQGAAAQAAAAAYRSDTRLWEIALRREPGSARAHAIMGELLAVRMQTNSTAATFPRLVVRAKTHCAMAMHLDPDAALSHLCEARVLTAQRDWAPAYAAFERALARSSAHRDRPLLAMANLALDLPDLPYEDRVALALDHLDRALREYPYAPEAAAVAARLYHRLGMPEEAAEHYGRARILRPERWEVVLWGLELELDLGHSSAAQDAWTEAEKRLRDADPTLKSSVGRKLGDARRLFAPGTFDPSSAPSSSVPLE